MSFIVSKPRVEVNRNAIPIKANSVEIGEGLGETTVTAASLGGDDVEVEISDSAEDKVGEFSFTMSTTIKNKASALSWKRNPGRNIVVISGLDPDGNRVSNVYSKATITNNYKAGMKNGGEINLEWKSEQPVVG